MLENPSSNASTVSAPTTTSVKRYAPPHQKNRTLNRRKSGERFERTNNFSGSDGEKNQVAAPRNIPTIGHGDEGSSNLLNENARLGLIALDGCCSSEASQLLNKRWAAVMYCYNNPSIDLSERPVMYSGSSASAWGHFRLPHQLMAPSTSVAHTGSQMDFLAQPRTRSVYAAPSQQLTLPQG